MQPKHLLGFALVLILGYYLGVKYPATGQAALSKVGM
jgi:hypothetical protein